MKKKIIIACGGPSSEHDVSLMSVSSILEHIDHSKYEISLFYITRDKQVACFTATSTFSIPENASYLPFSDGVEKYLKHTDLVVLSALHGEFGEDGTIQKILEENHIPYTGSSSEVSTLVMDKQLTSATLKYLPDLFFPKTTTIQQCNNTNNDTYPIFCKPNTLGSSVGAKVIHTIGELEEFVSEFTRHNPGVHMLVQEYIEGLEVSVGCLESSAGTFTPLPPIEIIPQTAEFFDYHSKYIVGESLEITPPTHISQKLSDKLSQLAIEIHQTLGCKLYSRSDFILRDEKIYFLETNTLPGMTANSLLPKEAKAVGIDFTQLITFLIENSL